MDEENNEGLNKKGQSSLKQGAEHLGKQTKRKLFMKKIITMLPIILYLFCGIIVAIIILSAISHFLDLFQGEQSKKANSSSIDYANSATEEKSPNRIVLNADKITEDGAYLLEFKFEDKRKTEKEQIKSIKYDILGENSELDITKFTDSELKIVAVLMYNGLDVKKYNEEELKALALFVKADIASNNFDLRSADEVGKEVDLNEIAENDYVYGTLELHRTKAAEGYDSETPLEYVPYGDEYTPGTFCYMDKNLDTDILNKFSIDEEGKAVFARSSSVNIDYTYKDGNKNELSIDEIKQKIPEDNIMEDLNQTYITATSFNYKQYIARYAVNYGFLSDLLITTENVDFCLDIAKLTFNGKIVINIKEELAITDSTKISTYNQTKLLYDYVTYEVSGQKEGKKIKLEQVATQNGSPNNSGFLKTYGWNSAMSHTQIGEYGNTLVYRWTKGEEKYQLNYVNITGYQNWTLYKEVEDVTYTDMSKEHGENELINLGQIKEEYEEYTIDEYYTKKEEFKYTIETNSHSESGICSYEISELDCWYLKYHKQYEKPVTEPSDTKSSTSEKGEFPKDATEVLTTIDINEINKIQEVKDFITKRQEKYKSDNSAANATCVVNALTVKEKVKTDEEEAFSSSTQRYKFGEEIVDTTETQMKNIEYVNNKPIFTKEDGEIGFLYIYDEYKKAGKDLFLENDSEVRLFELLEDDSTTYKYSNVIKYLLYIYDGIDRGVKDLNVKIVDIEGMNKIKGSSTQNYIKAWENGGLWAYETGQSTVFPTGYLTEDELNYIVFEDGSAGHNNIAYGICTFISSETNITAHNKDWGDGYYNWKTQFAEEGILVETLYEGAYVDKTIADTVFYSKILKNFIDKVNSYLDTNLPEYKFTRAQKDSLISVCYQYGNILGFDEVYKNALNEDGTIDGEKLRTWSKFNYSSTVNDRKYANWLLFTEGTYIDRAGNVIPVGSGSIAAAAYEVADYFLNSGVDVHYAGDSVDIATNNGRIVRHVHIQESWDLPIQNPERYGIVCATFVSFAIWKSGLIDGDTISEYPYHGTGGVDALLTRSEYADEWEVITNWDELQEGDIVHMQGHVFIFMEGEKCLDQSYCAITSGGTDLRRMLLDASKYRSKFIRGFRYVG